MSIDIIIPTLNEYSQLEVLLPYLKHHLPNNQSSIIVVDAQKSSDKTQELCRQHDIFYLKSKFNQRAAQLNEGVKKSKAKVILLLHADVTPPTTFASDISDLLSSDVDFGLFAYRLDSPKFMLKINSYFTQFDMLMAGGGDQCHFMTKSSFIQLGGYDESYDIMEDFEFFDRIKKSPLKYAIVQSKAKVSARKYDKNSWLRVNLVNLFVFMRYKFGAPPNTLKLFCDRWLG